MRIWFSKFWGELSLNKIPYFFISILSIVTLAWVLKKFLNVGDEVVAGISAALITLLGVHLTNKNSQLTLDKQLEQQKDTFNKQLLDQSEGFKEQIKHQNSMLDRQLKHQSEEKEKERKQKFKHDIYTNLAKQLSEIVDFFSKKMFFGTDTFEVVHTLSKLNEYINIAKTVSDHRLIKVLRELHKNCCDLGNKFAKESTLLVNLMAEEKKISAGINHLNLMNTKITENLFNNFDYSSSANDVELVSEEREKLHNKMCEVRSKIGIETQRLIGILKPDISKLKDDTEIIFMLINMEQGYNSIEELLSNYESEQERK